MLRVTSAMVEMSSLYGERQDFEPLTEPLKCLSDLSVDWITKMSDDSNVHVQRMSTNQLEYLEYNE